ncbi:MAG: ureidoglycolate lyase [Gammaproteobacteria bacterium]|nr:ureidoglycolate lyase [Gammaproteobacteria bacterium]
MVTSTNNSTTTLFELPLVKATTDNLKGYGSLSDEYETTAIEIVTWPAQGWRSVDVDTGNEGGTTEGVFQFWWQGDYLYGRNTAVSDEYLLGWSCVPKAASKDNAEPDRSQVLLYHANYHPDGGQLFFPKNKTPFVVPLALPGDDVTPEDFVAFYFDGTQGLYIHPGVWHEAVFPIADSAEFLDKQGKVHARVSCDFTKEFGVYLATPLRAPEQSIPHL